jgi:hypothetical protein
LADSPRGESLAFNADDGLMYRGTGSVSDAGRLDSIDLDTLTVTAFPFEGATVSTVQALTYVDLPAPDGSFTADTLGAFLMVGNGWARWSDFFQVELEPPESPTGAFVIARGELDHKSKGLAIVGTSVPSCPASPALDCQGSFEKGLLLVSERRPGRERIIAKWLRGPELAGTDLGNPLGSGGTAYSMCVYTDAGRLAGSYSVDRAGATCGTKDCWKNLGRPPGDPGHKGYRYRDRGASSDGIALVLVRAGDAGRSKAAIKGKNNSAKGQLALPTGVAAALTGSTSATVQLLASNVPECISVELTDVSRNDASQFKARK